MFWISEEFRILQKYKADDNVNPNLGWIYMILA